MTKYAEWCARQFWQYQRRGSWKYRWHGDTVVRYVETAPADPEFAEGLLEYLKSQESVAAATVYNRPARLGERWKAISAWYEQQEGQVDERTKLKLIRVYQALQRATEEGDGDGPYVVEDGCRYKVTFTYRWKVESLPDVPKGTSGVSWQLEQISRDDETGLWNCCLVKRERVQQDVAEYATDKTVFEKRSEEQHLGVKAGSVAETGKAAGVSDGRLVRRKVQKNEDCTSDVINETVEELEAEGASETVERTLRAEVTTTEDRNMKTKLGTEGLEPGTRVRNEKTPGGRWNRQKVVTTPKPPEKPVRETCQKTVFEHRHSKTEVREKRPEIGNKGEVNDVQDGDGKTVTESVRALDDGTFEKETEEREEKQAEEATVEVSKMLRGVRKTTVNRNMPSPASTEEMEIGSVVRNEKTEGGLWNQTLQVTEKTPVGKIQETCQKTALQHVHTRLDNVAEDPGEADAPEVSGGTIHRQEVRRTDEGTFDVTEVTDKAIAATDVTQGGTTVRAEVRTEYRNAEGIEVPSPSQNVEVGAQVRTNEHGLKDGVVTVATHQPATAAARGGAANRKVEVEAGINQVTEPTGSPGENVEVDIDVSPNEHGSMTTRKRTVTHTPATKTARGGTALYDEVETSTINDTAEPSEAGGAGKTVTCRANPNEHGSATTTKIVRTAKARKEGTSWTTEDDNFTYTHTVNVYRNWTGMPTVPGGKYSANMSLSINEFGLIDAVVTTVTRERKGGSSDGGDSQSTSGTETRYMYYQKKDGKMYKRRVTANFTARREAGGKLHTIMLNGAESGLGFQSHDNGAFGIKYTNIKVHDEEKVS